MKIYATKTDEVIVNPIAVIQKLLDKQLNGEYVKEKDGKYYRVIDIGGSHYMEHDVEITKEKYDYIKALILILNTLKEETE